MHIGFKPSDLFCTYYINENSQYTHCTFCPYLTYVQYTCVFNCLKQNRRIFCPLFFKQQFLCKILKINAEIFDFSANKSDHN